MTSLKDPLRETGNDLCPDLAVDIRFPVEPGLASGLGKPVWRLMLDNEEGLGMGV